MRNYINREMRSKILQIKNDFPAIAIIGPRQCGKTTFAKKIALEYSNSIYLDMETDSDKMKLKNPELFFDLHPDSIFFIDEIHYVPDLFRYLRSVIDKNNINGQFYLLGSASRDLISKSSESLAGRIIFLEMNSFTLKELGTDSETFNQYWLRGGFPRSYLASNDANSFIWRESFVKSFLEKDIPQLGFQVPASMIAKLWKMASHYHGQLVNYNSIANSLDLSHTTVRKYIDILSETFMLRLLSPFEINMGKRLVKSPKLYFRDHGIYHSMSGIESFNDLMGHPGFGSSWEGLVIDNLLSYAERWNYGFYRTQHGAEIDLILEKAKRRIAVECKTSRSPQLSKGFYESIKDLQISESYIICPVNEIYPLKKDVWVCSLSQAIERIFN